MFQFSSTSSAPSIARFRKLILLSRWNERRITTCYHHWSKGFDRSSISFRHSHIWQFWKLFLIALGSFWVWHTTKINNRILETNSFSNFLFYPNKKLTSKHCQFNSKFIMLKSGRVLGNLNECRGKIFVSTSSVSLDKISKYVIRILNHILWLRKSIIVDNLSRKRFCQKRLAKWNELSDKTQMSEANYYEYSGFIYFKS